MDYEISRIKHVADYSRNTDIYYEVRVKKKEKKVYQDRWQIIIWQEYS